MARKSNKGIITDTANPHTIKKFELVENYVTKWAQKLLNYKKCKGIIFIDCMSNSGVYKDNVGKEVFGIPIRVANYISKIMPKYHAKQARLFFNDLSQDKIDELKTHLPANTANFNITTQSGDRNKLLKSIQLSDKSQESHLLVYDPYTASIDWSALKPFFHNWGEVIINHMVYDTIRGISQAKSDAAIEKYEQTYLAKIEELINCRGDRDAYEKLIKNIIIDLKGGSANEKYFIASFPFFNRRNVIVYNLIHCSSNIAGFKLFKEKAWKTFGGKSSSKNTHGSKDQLLLNIAVNGVPITQTDEHCYYVQDIARYIHEKFAGQAKIALKDVWATLDEHPVFPSEGYNGEIKKELKSIYGDVVSKSSITFTK